MAAAGKSGKTITNKATFLSAALNGAVEAGHIPSNPAAGHRMPRTEKTDMMCMSRDEFGKLLEVITERWRPLVEFLVVSGCRWSEATALRPSDIDREHGTVRITRAWKRTYAKGGYELGPPKSKRSVRTINVPPPVLDKLDYTGEWLFTNQADRPVRHNGFHERVWGPAVARAGLDPRPRVHDLRHTCASGWWLLGCRCRSCRRIWAMSRSTPRSRSTATSTGAARKPRRRPSPRCWTLLANASYRAVIETYRTVIVIFCQHVSRLAPRVLSHYPHVMANDVYSTGQAYKQMGAPSERSADREAALR